MFPSTLKRAAVGCIRAPTARAIVHVQRPHQSRTLSQLTMGFEEIKKWKEEKRKQREWELAPEPKPKRTIFDLRIHTPINKSSIWNISYDDDQKKSETEPDSTPTAAQQHHYHHQLLRFEGPKPPASAATTPYVQNKLKLARSQHKVGPLIKTTTLNTSSDTAVRPWREEHQQQQHRRPLFSVELPDLSSSIFAERGNDDDDDVVYRRIMDELFMVPSLDVLSKLYVGPKREGAPRPNPPWPFDLDDGGESQTESPSLDVPPKSYVGPKREGSSPPPCDPNDGGKSQTESPKDKVTKGA